VRQFKLPGRTGPGDSTLLSLACPYMELPKEKVSDTINKVIFRTSEQSFDFIELVVVDGYLTMIFPVIRGWIEQK
jgi:hypothetical protein